MYNSITTNNRPNSNNKVLIIVTFVLIALWLVMICSSCKSSYPKNYPVVHKDKIMSVGSNPNRR